MDATLGSAEHRSLHVEVSRVPVFRPLAWLYRGWADMRGAASLGYGALIVALGWTILVFCGTHPYFIAAAISGFLLVGPLMSAGLCEMSRRYALGQTANFDESLDGFARNRTALFEFGAILATCAVVWFGISAVMLGTVFHIAAPDMSDTLYQGFFDSTNRSQVLAYVAVGGLLAAAVFAVSVVAIPLIIDKHATAGQAMRASLSAVFSNVPAMMVWSALILILTIIGYATLLIGLLFVAPLLGHATWHAYKDMIR
ncbi:MAG TPA: DUF2189 domain-containing protein [Steroidobacteraceae bacterium]|nr:DUF2189 domain-containing protein [Steroidobacteraceae bacterium]